MSHCPHPNCGKEKPYEMYACKMHWFSLPKKIRDAIWKAFREEGPLTDSWGKADEAARSFWSTK